VHLVGFITKKFVAMHGYMNVKEKYTTTFTSPRHFPVLKNYITATLNIQAFRDMKPTDWETVLGVHKLLDYLNLYKQCCENYKYCSQKLLGPE